MLELSEDGHKVEYVVQDKDLRVSPDLALIRDLLRKSHYAAFHLRDDLIEQFLLVLAAPQEPGRPSLVGQRFVVAEALDARVVVSISDDRMTAAMRVASPEGGAPITLDYIRTEIRRAGVNAGLDAAAIAHLIRESAQLPPGQQREAVIARGRLPERGKDAWRERLVSTAAERMLKPQLRADGTVDMRDLGSMVTVGAGEPLMRKHPATAGVAGIDVTGAPIPPIAGEDITFIAGDGCSFAANDPNLIVSAREGAPVETDTGMKVDDVVILNKVDVSTGHVRFKGSVIIEGDIREGMQVESEGDVTVSGCIDSATVIAGGTVAVKQGIIGHQRDVDSNEIGHLSAIVQAGRDIHAAFAQYAELRADVSVQLERFCTHCHVVVGEQVIVGNPEKPAGKLIGGLMEVGQKVVTGEIGTPAGARTVIDLSPRVRRLRDLMAQIVRELKEKRAQMDLTRRQIDEMQQTLKGEVDTNLMIACQEAQDLAESFEPLKEELRKVRDQHDATVAQLRIEAHRSCHQGNTVRFMGKNLLIDSEHGPSDIHLVDGELALEPHRH